MRNFARASLLATASLTISLTSAGIGTAPASAATCANYATQQAAQDAKDTYDGDGDGIFCETLPCPCSPEWTAQHATSPPAQSPQPVSPQPTKSYVYSGRITRVVDGDTLKVRIRKRIKTVRILGVDTPESHKPNVAPECGSSEATSSAFKWSFDKPLDFDRDGLFDHGRRGRSVRLRTDNTQSKHDQYGRLLAYVSRGSNDLGKWQVAQGWAELFVFASIPFKRLASYQAKFDQAQAAGRGVWSLCAGDFHSNQ